MSTVDHSSEQFTVNQHVERPCSRILQLRAFCVQDDQMQHAQLFGACASEQCSCAFTAASKSLLACSAFLSYHSNACNRLPYTKGSYVDARIVIVMTYDP